MATRKYQICNRCIMDTSDEEIQFDSEGNCNHCSKYLNTAKENLLLDPNIAKQELSNIVSAMKSAGKGKKFDCVFGVSGGVDSTYLAYKLKELGLRVLAVHIDNGWNSELSVKNIENTLRVLDIDLYTHVLDWNEFKDLQLSFLKSSTPDSEIPTDYAITAVLREIASKFDVKYIVTGSNVATEAIMGSQWSQGHRDWRYISSIQRIFGKRKLKTYPHYGLLKFIYYQFIKRQKLVKLLNLLDYNKDSAMELIQRELEWKYYGGKHYESIYTRIYQGYILPEKFGFDKRRAHFSSLIMSSQMSREDALTEMEKHPYPSMEMLEEDKEYLIKKFDLSDREFQEIMEAEPKRYHDYPNYHNYWPYRFFRFVYRFLMKRKLIKRIPV